MGKPKATAERVKGNLKPSSSSRAAELLGSTGFNSGGIPMGLTFSSFSPGSSSPSSSTTNLALSDSLALDPRMGAELSSDIQVILKKLAKRNSTTKLKALDELVGLIKLAEVEELGRFLPVWLGFYSKLSSDLERRVRLVANQILGHTVVKIGKLVTPHLKGLLGPWLLSIHDPSKDVASTARGAFEDLFPTVKQSSAIRFSHTEILELIETNLIVYTPESFSDPRFFSKEEMGQRHTRLIVSTLGAFGFLLEKLSTEAREGHALYSELLENPKFLGFLSHEDVAIRNSGYMFMIRLVSDAPELMESRLDQFSSHFLMKALQEKNGICHGAMLDAVLVATQKFPALWEGTKKPSFSRLVQFVQNGCYGSMALVHPALSLLISRLPAGILSMKGIEGLLSALLSPKEPLSPSYVTASEVMVALADNEHLPDPLSGELTDLLVIKSMELLSKGYLGSTPVVTSESAAILILKVMNRLWYQHKVEGADDYANEIEALLFQVVQQDSVLSHQELMQVVSLIGCLSLQRRNFLGDFAAQTQEKFYAILDQLICLCMEKLDSEIKVPNCFIFICLVQTHLAQLLSEEHQSRGLEFFRTRMVKLIPSYDVALGLSTFDGLSQDVSDLVQVACQPTNLVPYPSKARLVSYLLDKEVVLRDLEPWLLTTLQNLMLAPELNLPSGSAWIPGCLESLLAKVLCASAGTFSTEFFPSFGEAFSQNIARFKSRSSDSDLHTQRLEGVMGLLCRVVIAVFEHPGHELGVDRLGSSISQLISLCSPYAHSTFDESGLPLAWHAYFGKGKPGVVQEILEPLLDQLAGDSSDPKHSASLAEEIAQVARCLLQADWPLDKIDGLLARVLPSSSTWIELHKDLVQQHSLDPLNLSLTYPEGYILSAQKEPPARNLSKFSLAGTLSFSATLIASLPASSKPCVRQLAVFCFLTDVLFAWVGTVVAGQDSASLLHLDLAESAWKLLEDVGLGISFTSEPPSNPRDWPLVLDLVYSLPDSVPGLSSLTAGLVWYNAIKRNAFDVPDSWQKWMASAAIADPRKGVSLLKSTALLSASLLQSTTLLEFQLDLAEKLVALPPSQVVKSISDGLVDPLLLFYSLIGFELPRPKCQALNYWIIAVLKLAASDRQNLDQAMVWGLMLPTLEFTIENSYHQPLNSLNVDPIVSQDSHAWDDILDSYSVVFELIQNVLQYPASPLAYLMKRNALALLDSLSGLSTGQFSHLVSWPQYREPISKLILDLILAEYLPTEILLAGPRFGFLTYLSSSTGLVLVSDLELKSPTNQLCGLLHSKHPGLAKSAAKLLLLLLPSQIQTAKEQLGSQAAPRIPLPLIALSQQDPHTSNFGQLLAWLLLLRTCELASYELKLIYIEQIQASGGILPLVTLIIELLGIADPHPFDCGPWDVTGILLDGLEATTFPGLPLLAAHLYFRLLQVLPSLTRAWWTECNNRNLIQNFESYTERHFSGRLVAAAMEHVSHPENLAKLADDAFTYRVGRSEVAATYLIDECPIEMTLRLPSAYPLKLAEVEGFRHAGVPEKQWRAWLLGSTTILTSQNGSIFDSLEQFKSNASLHFAGKSDCMICYSVVGVLDRSLPNRQCRTCRNKFHAGCLYKWIQSSSQSTCPLCRNLF